MNNIRISYYHGSKLTTSVAGGTGEVDSASMLQAVKNAGFDIRNLPDGLADDMGELESDIEKLLDNKGKIISDLVNNVLNAYAISIREEIREMTNRKLSKYGQ